MKNLRQGYENIDESTTGPSKSIYNPLFDDENDEQSGSTQTVNRLVSKTQEESPYEEVAANIPNTDDPTLLVVTLRSILIGIILTCLFSFITQFFAYRTAPLDMNIGLIILVSYMSGELLFLIIPRKIGNTIINPGRMSVKEHALVTVMATSGTYVYQGIESLTIQRIYYHYHPNNVVAILFIFIMQMIALSVAGILNRYLVWPAGMIWPKSIMACSLIQTLVGGDENNEKTKSSWTISRAKFFWIAVLCQFVYYWFPGFIFPMLTSFSIICFFAPKNILLSQITGSNGLALGAFQFDWNSWVGYLDSPILVPFWAHVNIFCGFIVVVWIATPIIYYTNTWQSKTMPILSTRVFDQNGYFYNTTKVLDVNRRLNHTAYQIYGDVYMTGGVVVSYFFLFAGGTSLIVHTILYHGRSIVEQFRSDISDKKNDIHAKLMSYYPQVPDWCYIVLFLFAFTVGLITFDSVGLIPGYGFIVSVCMSLVLALPDGIIGAMTNVIWMNTAPGDLVSGLILPGNPIGFLAFRVYTNTLQCQTLIYLSNFKIGHYMKISPRVVFAASFFCSLLSAIVHQFTASYLMNNVKNICTLKNPAWQCLNAENTYSSSITFSISNSFLQDPKYSMVLYGFLVGAIVPFITWGLWKTFPRVTWLGLINTPIFFMATNNLPPAPSVEFPSWFLVGFIFNFIIYRYAHQWWNKYAYILSAAMNCGVVVCGLLIFFIFQLNEISFPEWWGTGGRTGDGCPLAIANFSGFITVREGL